MARSAASSSPKGPSLLSSIESPTPMVVLPPGFVSALPTPEVASPAATVVLVVPVAVLPVPTAVAPYRVVPLGVPSEAAASSPPCRAPASGLLSWS